MSRKSFCGELLQQTAEWIALRPHTPFFNHHIALFVKLAHDRVKETLGLEIGPQLEPVFGQGIVILGLIVAGGGVHVLAATLLHNFAEFVGHDVLVGCGNRILPGFLQFLQLGFVLIHPFIALSNVGGIRRLHLLQSRLFGSIVLGSNLVRALERHVLEHVRQPGLLHGVLNRPRVHHRIKREHRRFRTLADD